MKSLLKMLAALGLLGSIAGVGSSACVATCQDLRECCPDGTLDCPAATDTLESRCVPGEGSVPDLCGVFVSPQGSDSGAGTRASPFATIAWATQVLQQNGGRIYLCAGTFTEAVTLWVGPFSIYGGLDCANGWTYDGASTTVLMVPSDVIPLHVGQWGYAYLAAMTIRSADAKMQGGSSIAILAEGSVSLERVSVEAGNGAPGAPGEPVADAAAPGPDGNMGGEACSAVSVVTGPVKNACPGIESIGGAGGTGQDMVGGAGSPGEPQGGMNGGDGEAAAGCTGGMKGDDGASGVPGAGAEGLGALDATGYLGVSGSDGAPGTTAQGGGGGGGARGGTGANKCADPMKSGGASGASGGAGGCGGKGGKGGGPGGASIGIVSLNDAVHITGSGSRITTASGGKGGGGGGGQPGGPGGKGGTGGAVAGGLALMPGCDGGPGGKGGDGGRGGGGRGGHSIGIAYARDAPEANGVTFTLGSAGEGGLGEGPSGNGAAGLAVETTPL